MSGVLADSYSSFHADITAACGLLGGKLLGCFCCSFDHLYHRENWTTGTQYDSRDKTNCGDQNSSRDDYRQSHCEGVCMETGGRTFRAAAPSIPATFGWWRRSRSFSADGYLVPCIAAAADGRDHHSTFYAARFSFHCAVFKLYDRCGSLRSSTTISAAGCVVGNFSIMDAEDEVRETQPSA